MVKNFVTLVCSEYTSHLSLQQYRWVQAIQAITGLYYIGLAMMGFRNIVVIFFV